MIMVYVIFFVSFVLLQYKYFLCLDQLILLIPPNVMHYSKYFCSINLLIKLLMLCVLKMAFFTKKIVHNLYIYICTFLKMPDYYS